MAFACAGLETITTVGLELPCELGEVRLLQSDRASRERGLANADERGPGKENRTNSSGRGTSSAARIGA